MAHSGRQPRSDCPERIHIFAILAGVIAVAMIDADLVLFAYALGLRLNSISYNCLVMACGLAVDYCMHLGHTFDHSKKGGVMSNKAAARHAVAQMGGA